MQTSEPAEFHNMSWEGKQNKTWEPISDYPSDNNSSNECKQ